MDQGGRIERRTALIETLVTRSIREFEELEGFDAMEIARALLAVALARVERQSPVNADGVGYLNYLKHSKAKLIAEINAHTDECARAYDADKAAQLMKEDSCRN